MVKFIGGPSINAYKSYRNHTVAREGQWRNLRPSYNTKSTVNIKIRNYGNHGHSYGGYGFGFGGFQLPAWMQWAQFGLNWLTQLFPQKQPTVDETNPFAAQLEELKAENEELKKKLEQKQPSPEPVKPNGEVPSGEVVTPDPGKGNVEPLPLTNPEGVQVETETTPDASEIKIKTVTTQGVEAKEGELLTTEVKVPKAKKNSSDNSIEYHGWNTLCNSYGIPNTREFRDWFRQKYLNGNDVWKSNTAQNFPNTIVYPEGSQNKYEFNKGKFLEAPLDKHFPKAGTSNVKEGTTKAIRGEGTPAQAGKTTTTGSISATINGKTYTATATHEGANGEQTVKNELIKELVSKGLTQEQAQKAIKNAKIKNE